MGLSIPGSWLRRNRILILVLVLGNLIGLVSVLGLPHSGLMPEIVQMLHRGASQITPRILKGIHRKLPMLKVEFAQINSPAYPHLVDQLEFLADVVEDFAEGADDDIPYTTAASAAYALVYAHRQTDLIPDRVPLFGHADDSGVVRAVLIEHERVLSEYAQRHGVDWSQITLNA